MTTGSISDWTHVAVTLKNSGSHIDSNIYINGALNKRESLSNAALGQVTGSLISFIGALQTAPSGSPTIKLVLVNSLVLWTNSDTGRQKDHQRISEDITGLILVLEQTLTKQIQTWVSTTSLTKVLRLWLPLIALFWTIQDMSNGAWTGYQSGARSTESAIVLSKLSKRI